MSEVEASKNGGSEATKPPAAKRAKMTTPESGVVAQQQEERDFDEETQKALEEIDQNQNEIDILNEKASEEILKVEQKYNKLRKPYFGKRNQIIERIPKFWLTAFINHPQISPIIEEDEEEALQFMNKLEVEEFEDIKSGYVIKFHFDHTRNPYFDNQVLSKEFLLGALGEAASQSTKINWKEGHNLSAKAAMKSEKNNSGKRSRLEKPSFFGWFSDNTEPAADEIAEVIKDDMWPNPLQYFLVPDIEVENGGDDDDEDDEDDDEDDDEEEGEEDNVVLLEEEDEEEEEAEEEEENAAPEGGGGGE